MRASGTYVAVAGWKGDIYLSEAANASMTWFEPGPGLAIKNVLCIPAAGQIDLGGE